MLAHYFSLFLYFPLFCCVVVVNRITHFSTNLYICSNFAFSRQMKIRRGRGREREREKRNKFVGGCFCFDFPFIWRSHVIWLSPSSSVAGVHACECMRWNVAIIVIVPQTEVSISRMHIVVARVRVWCLVVLWKIPFRLFGCVGEFRRQPLTVVAAAATSSQRACVCAWVDGWMDAAAMPKNSLWKHRPRILICVLYGPRCLTRCEWTLVKWASSLSCCLFYVTVFVLLCTKIHCTLCRTRFI